MIAEATISKPLDFQPPYNWNQYYLILGEDNEKSVFNFFDSCNFIIPAANTFALEPEGVSAEGESATKTQNILDASSIYYRFDLGCQCNGWGYCGKSSQVTFI